VAGSGNGDRPRQRRCSPVSRHNDGRLTVHAPSRTVWL
jgi:hypothetical protein